MDIVVTIPRKEFGNIKKEDEWFKENPNSVWFWAISRKPKNLNKGDRVFFVENNQITHYGVFDDFIYNPVCEVTGRVWFGLNMLFRKPAVDIKPMPYKGFRGFRYCEFKHEAP